MLIATAVRNATRLMAKPIGAVVLASALTVLAGCASSPAAGPGAGPGRAPSADMAVQTLEVVAGRCFGACPSYRFTASRTGTVAFEGLRDTASHGVHQARIDASAVRRALDRMEPWRLRVAAGQPFVCDNRITDQPTYQVTWTLRDGQRQSVRYDRGCLSADGRAFAATLDDLPRILRLEPLVGAPGKGGH